MLWAICRIYARLYALVKKTTGFHLKGGGFLLRRLRHDHELQSSGFRWWVDHRIAGTYASLLRGSVNEPETLDFLRYVADALNQPFGFVDVGANIGELLLPLASHPRCAVALAFEPHPICAAALQRNLSLNGASAEVMPAVVGDGTLQAFVSDNRSTQESRIRHDVDGVPLTRTVRLDDELDHEHETILLIDVEGAELQVLRGAQVFIRERRPLVVFEYHQGTRERFSLQAVRDVLGTGYRISRLRSDGHLDADLGDTWNCVAVHEESVFFPITEKRFVPA